MNHNKFYLMDIIGHLPIEIAQEIFKYLGGTDLSNCCRISKQWRNCANSDLLWKNICIKKGIICEPEYYNSEWPLEPLVDWGRAYMEYIKRRFNNWRSGEKIESIINTCYDTIACCDGDTLAFTNASRMLFVYDMSRKRPHCVQTIKLESARDILALDMTRGHLIIRQGDAFAIYVKQKIIFSLKGYLLRHEDCYVFTQHHYDTNEGSGLIRYCVIEDGICILVDHSLFICNILGNVEIHNIGVPDRTVLLHDHYRAYVVTGDKRITGFDINLNYDDFDLPVESLIAMKSNKEIVVGLISSENVYDFTVWNLKYGRRKTFVTHRPFGFEVHAKQNKFAYVALDKFNLRLLLVIQDLEYGITYEIDLNDVSIAQVKINFIGKDLLYCATRSDWDIYDNVYVIDLKTMKILYEDYISPNNIVSVDSKHAVYVRGEVIQIHTYLD